MEPLTIVRTVWRHRLLAAPVLLLVLLGACYVLFFGPRVYEASATYVLVNPQVPTADQMDRDARLARLDSDNPYLRASDPSLIVQVMIARLSADVTAEALVDAGLGPDYTVAQSAGNGLILVITGTSGTPGKALATTRWLSDQLQQQLRTVQKVNGADDLYLFTALPVDVDSGATEKLSSRLRSLILVAIGGAVLLFGAVSAGTALESARAARRRPGLTGQEDAAVLPASSTLAASWSARVNDDGPSSHVRPSRPTVSAGAGQHPSAVDHHEKGAVPTRHRARGGDAAGPADWSW